MLGGVGIPAALAAGRGRAEVTAEEVSVMDVGILIKWGAPVHGREKESVALFEEVLDYGKRLLDEEKITFFEPFLFGGGDLEVERGFILIKGEVTSIFALMESEEYRSFYARSLLTTTHVYNEMVAAGDGFIRSLEDYKKALVAVGV